MNISQQIPYLAKTLKILILALLIMGTCSYLFDAVSKYNSKRIGISTVEQPRKRIHQTYYHDEQFYNLVNSVVPRTTFEFPSIVLCVTLPSFVMRDRLILYVKHSMMPKGGNITTDAKQTGFYTNETMNANFTEDYNAFQDLLMVGSLGKAIQCTIYRVPDGYVTPYSMYHELLLKVPQLDDMYQERPFVYLKAGHSKLLTPFTEILGSSDLTLPRKPNVSRAISITVEAGEYIRLKTQDRPCLPDEEMADLLKKNSSLADMLSCFNRYITSLVPCYDNGLGGQCSKEDQHNIGRKIKELYDGGETEFLKRMSCKIPCRMPTYKVTEQSTYEWAEKGKVSHLYLAFYVPKPSFTVTEEFLMYDIGDLAGDVGGMVGMLLGASLFGLYKSIHKSVLKYFAGNK